jgi:class 3 adenylate cyclase
MVGCISPALDSASFQQDEKLHPLSCCFLKYDLEDLYRDYQFELSRHSLHGRFGSLSISSMVICLNQAAAYVQQIVKIITVSTPGSIERMIIGIPLSAFAFYHQFLVHTGGVHWNKKACKTFVVHLTLLYAFSEMMVAYVNDLYPDSEGCLAIRFRCPYTFSGPKFSLRGAIFGGIIIFNLTPCMSFLAVVKLMISMFTISRALGFTFHRKQLSVSVWSTLCMCLQICAFLGFRYAQELHDRKRFLLQLHITRLRSSLQELLDSMMPRNLSRRVQGGETVIDAVHHTTVLFCSFPLDASPQSDLVRSFHLLDKVHEAFDELLKQRGTNAFKVDFVGNDYMLTRPILATGRDVDGADAEKAVESAFCVSLALLAAQMRAEAQRILAGSGLDLRFAVYSGPVVLAVIGESCRHLRVVGEAVDAARSLCDAAEPWQVLSAGWAAETLRGGGMAVRARG